VKEHFLNLGHFQLNNSGNIHFWEDRWLGNFTLSQQYPSLYAITHQRNVSVTSVFSTIPLNIAFQRGLVGNNLALWLRLVARVAHVRLNGEPSRFIWGLLQSGMFSVKSMYKAMIIDTRVRNNTILLKLKVPLRIKIFMWYLKQGVVLTKDNLVRWDWRGSNLCVFGSQIEMIQHLFFYYHFAKFLWRAVQVTFNIDVPLSMVHRFHGWVNDIGNQLKKLVLVGAAALCLALWTRRNDMMFDNSLSKSYMQVLL
jgi:hypothetical protein